MSKAIIEIEKPKRCKDCFWYQADAWFGGSCRLVKEEDGWNKQIGADEEYDVQKWCPLLPKTEAIPIELYEQIKGERDVAIEQLKSLNIELFEKPYLKAIPIKWIDGYIKRRANDVNIYAEILFISDMVKEWVKENEQKTSD